MASISKSAFARATETISATYQKAGIPLTPGEAVSVHTNTGMLPSSVAPLLKAMGIPEASGPVTTLDMACGGGVFTQEVRKALPAEVLLESSFTLADINESSIDLVKKRIGAETWSNAEAKVLDATKSGLPADTFTHVAIPLGLHIIPDPDAAVRDSIRVLKPGGMFGATTFHADNGRYFWYQDMRSAFKTFPFEAPFPDVMPMQIHQSGTWTDEAWVEAHAKELGLEDVRVEICKGGYRFSGAEEFCEMLSGMVGMVMKWFWSEELREAHPVKEVKGLLREFLEKEHGDEGWETSWIILCLTGKAPQ